MPSKSDLEAMTAVVTGRELVDADKLALYIDPKELAVALGGEVVGDNQIVCPGPGHSAIDRSLSVLVSPSAPDGFVVKSFTDDHWRDCRDMVMDALRGLPIGQRRSFVSPSPAQRPEDRKTFRYAQRLWNESVPAAGTIIETAYMPARGLTLPLPPVIRFHGAVRHHPGMLAKVTNISDRVLGFHCTYLRADGRWKIATKPDRRTFGPIKGGAVRLGPVGESLLVAEGIETALTAMQIDTEGRPAWAALSAGNLAVLELPPSVRSVVIIPDGDENGTSQRNAAKAAQRWLREGRSVRMVKTPVRPGFKGTDLNDLFMEELGLRRPLFAVEEAM